MVLVLALVLLLIQKDCDWLAGATLALTLQKPTLFLALPWSSCCTAAGRCSRDTRRRCGAGGASISITGLGAVSDYMDLVGRYHLTPYQMPTARGIAANLGLPVLWPVLAALALALLIWAIRRLDTGAAFALAVVGSLF